MSEYFTAVCERGEVDIVSMSFSGENGQLQSWVCRQELQINESNYEQPEINIQFGNED